MNDVTQILQQIESGDPSVAESLLPLVYDELRQLAAARLAQEQPGQTLQATALVHEAYMKLVGDRGFNDRQHFFRVAAIAMRQILVDRARTHRRTRDRGQRSRVGLSQIGDSGAAPAEELMALDEVLQRFAQVDPVKAELVNLRYFAGLSEQETADVLGISRATASRYWKFARAWLIQALEE
ncbi:MAG: sigma-70 family RNA polymerase sigma factor [Planctomycetaceae bacterium]|nr:sigma-70 family RNA polymerase sigma factor [Planctomycetaceae bacterium]